MQNIGTGVAPRTVHIDNQAVETVTRFTYLGSDIDSDGYSYPEIYRRLGIAGSIVAQPDNVWRQQRLIVRQISQQYWSNHALLDTNMILCIYTNYDQMF